MAKTLLPKPRAGVDEDVKSAVVASSAASLVSSRPTSSRLSGMDGLAKLSLSVAADVGKQLRYGAVDHDVSESAIVEVALRELFVQGEEAVSLALRKHGASKRRKTA
jgi:hypothetical protein